MTKLRLLKPHGLNDAGAIIEPQIGVAEILIERGIAEAIEQEVQTPTQRAASTRPRKRSAKKRTSNSEGRDGTSENS